MRGLAILVLGGAMVASAATAQVQTQEQRYGFNAIQRDDLTAAEARLIAQRAAEPGEPSVLLNLAHVYAKTGRAEQAMALYREVLTGENVLMATATRAPAWSHDLARRGLDRTRSIASR